MATQIKLLYPHHQFIADGKELIEVTGTTVGECVADLCNQYPAFKQIIFDPQKKLYNFITFNVNGVSIQRSPDQLAEIVKDGDEVAVFLLIAGG